MTESCPPPRILHLHHANVVADVGDAVVVACLGDQHPVARLERLESLEPLGEQRQLPAGLALDHADAEGGEGDERLPISAQGPRVDNVHGLRER